MPHSRFSVASKTSTATRSRCSARPKAKRGTSRSLAGNDWVLSVLQKDRIRTSLDSNRSDRTSLDSSRSDRTSLDGNRIERSLRNFCSIPPGATRNSSAQRHPSRWGRSPGRSAPGAATWAGSGRRVVLFTFGIFSAHCNVGEVEFIGITHHGISSCLAPLSMNRSRRTRNCLGRCGNFFSPSPAARIPPSSREPATA